MKKPIYIVALDGSEWSDRAAEWAVKLAKQTGASVKFITVISYSGFQFVNAMEYDYIPEMRKEQEREAKDDILAPVIAKYNDSGVPIVGEYYWGHPVEVIREQIKKEKADMFFAGRRGRSRISDLVLGSVSNSLAHTVGIPIVLVP
jgi:nucleotide-binding universal stress UspA family protein